MIFTTDLGLPEAPLLLADGTWLVAELAFERGRITKVSADGGQKWTMAETGRPNGLALDRNGDVWCCETLTPSLIKMAPDGTCETVLTEVEGVPLLWPYISQETDRKAVEVMVAFQQAFGKSYLVGPQVPADRVRTLRTAFAAAF